MEDIGLFLKLLPNVFGFTLKSPNLSHSLVNHKNINVMVYSYQNVYSLHDTLAYFLLDLPLAR